MSQIRYAEDKIGFRDLSVHLKILVVVAWIFVGINVLLFLAGFFSGLME